VVIVDFISVLTDDHGENENKRLGWAVEAIRDMPSNSMSRHVLGN